MQTLTARTVRVAELTPPVCVLNVQDAVGCGPPGMATSRLDPLTVKVVLPWELVALTAGEALGEAPPEP